MKRFVFTGLIPVLAAMVAQPLFAGSLMLVPAQDCTIYANCGSTVHDFVATVNAPIVTVETGDGVAGLKSAWVGMSFANVRTGDTDRDQDMRKRFNADSFPAIAYTVKSFESTKSGATLAKGELTWNGVTKTLDVPVTVVRKGNELAVDATFTVDHREWGLKKVRSMLMLTVDPELKFTVKLRGKLEAMPTVATPAPTSPAPAATAAPAASVR
jgi:hypothetical protein